MPCHLAVSMNRLPSSSGKKGKPCKGKNGMAKVKEEQRSRL